jgi:antitoxin HigA-1
VNGRSGISPEMAIRLGKAFGGGAETWFRLQKPLTKDEQAAIESLKKLVNAVADKKQKYKRPAMRL